MRVRFKRNFSWHVPQYNGQVTVKYIEGDVRTVPRDAADAAIRDGAAEEVKEPATRKARAEK